MSPLVEDLPTTISTRYFERETHAHDDDYDIITDWVVKLQQAGRSVNEWIRASLSGVKKITLINVRHNT